MEACLVIIVLHLLPCFQQYLLYERRSVHRIDPADQQGVLLGDEYECKLDSPRICHDRITILNLFGRKRADHFASKLDALF